MNQNLFLEPPSNSKQRQETRSTFGASLIVHGAVIALLISISGPFAPGPEPDGLSHTEVTLVTPPPSIWMDPPRLKPRIQSPKLVEAPKRIQLELKRQAAPAPERIELKPTPSLVIESAPQLELPPDELPEIAQPKIQVGGFSTAAADLERHKPKLKLASIGFGAASAGATRRATPQAKVVGFGSASTSAVVGKPARRPSTAAFGTATAGQTAGGPAAPSSPSSYRPIRIMKKPQPVYTQEARANESRRRRAAGGALWRRQPSQSAQSRTRTRIWTRPSGDRRSSRHSVRTGQAIWTAGRHHHYDSHPVPNGLLGLSRCCHLDHRGKLRSRD